MPHELNFVVPDSCQGQIVEYAYAATKRGITRRWDRSDDSVQIYWTKRDGGRRHNETELKRYDLTERS